LKSLYYFSEIIFVATRSVLNPIDEHLLTFSYKLKACCSANLELMTLSAYKLNKIYSFCIKSDITAIVSKYYWHPFSIRIERKRF